jgi:hypothetical protein
MKLSRFAILLAVAIICIALFATAAWACPMCKDSLASTKNDLQQTGSASVGGAFNKSIYTMILGFFSALGIVAFNLYRGIRK